MLPKGIYFLYEKKYSGGVCGIWEGFVYIWAAFSPSLLIDSLKMLNQHCWWWNARVWASTLWLWPNKLGTSGLSSFLAAISGKPLDWSSQCAGALSIWQNFPLLRDFFLNLDNLHDYLKYTFPKVSEHQEESERPYPPEPTLFEGRTFQTSRAMHFQGDKKKNGNDREIFSFRWKRHLSSLKRKMQQKWCSNTGLSSFFLRPCSLSQWWFLCWCLDLKFSCRFQDQAKRVSLLCAGPGFTENIKCPLFDGFPKTMGATEHSKNSRSREFSWELGSFFLARPREISLHISFPSRNMRLWKKISHSGLEPWDVERKDLALVSNPEMLRKKSRSRLELWDLKKKILVLFSNLEIESNFF